MPGRGCYLVHIRLKVDAMTPSFVTTGTRHDYLWLTLPEDVGMENADSIEKQVYEAVTEQNAKVVIDMKQVAILYSSGIGLMIRLRKHVASLNGYLCLVNIKDRIRQMFIEVNLDKIFPMYTTDTEFEVMQDDIWEKSNSEEDIGFISVVQEEEGICRINLSGNMTVTQDLEQFNTSIFKNGVNDYVFDLSGLDRIDSFGTAYYLNAINFLRQRQANCIAYGANESVNEVFETLEIRDLIPVYHNEREAINAIRNNYRQE
ncbi:MAG: STAS domain-containing protein [Chitinivibrionales bacterium]|nr:STAS domain-containing protein [Chitinivibrionales bacterium]